VPDAGPVVQVVEAHPALGGGAVLGGQVSQPVCDVLRPDLGAGVVRVVTGDQGPGRPDAVAAVGPPLGGPLLRAGPGRGGAGRPAAGLGRPADQRDGEDGVRAGAPVLLDELVGGRAVGQRLGVVVGFGDVLEEPVRGAVGGVVPEVVAGGGVAAP